ncbi:MAG TPA: hypothetical protein VEK75_08730, partial [Xanthobacteraceae bacterium]|nr:hypothetical protein [Xanthobacteraceae bacterium]
ETTLFSNATVGWGVSPYGVVNTTFNKAQVMPTVELNVPLVAGNVGTMPLLFSLDLTAMFPTGGTSTQTVTLGGYTGTLGFQQGFFGTAEIEAKIPLGVPIGTPPNAGAWSLVFGGGLAVDQTKTSAVFPTAYDNFSSTNTDIQPLVTAGLTFPLFNGIEAEVKVSETFSGTGMNIIGVNGSSQGQYQVNNVTAITAKLTTPLDEIGALLDELLPIHGPPVH